MLGLRSGRAVRRPLLLCVAAVLVLMMSAPAAAAAPESGQAPAIAVLPSSIYDFQHCGPALCLSAKFDGYLGYNARQLASWLTGPNRRGHFELFGPAGHIANSADKLWRYNEYFEVNGLWTGNKDALWCSRFWVYDTATKHWGTISGNYCFRPGSS